MPCHALGFLASNRYWSGLPIEVLRVIVDQGSAKLKVGKVCPNEVSNLGSQPGLLSIGICKECIRWKQWLQLFFTAEPFESSYLIIPHLRDPINRCIEPEIQRSGMNFRWTFKFLHKIQKEWKNCPLLYTYKDCIEKMQLRNFIVNT